MSMLSAQCDELRAMAESVGLAMPQAATLMMQAADTIWELRDSVHRERAENAKLRNEVDNFLDFEHLTSVAVAYAGCDECGEYKQTMLRLFAENDKLRELFDITYGYYVSGTLVPCDICGKYDCEGNAPTTCKADEYDPDGMVVEEIKRRMHELGIGVTK